MFTPLRFLMMSVQAKLLGYEFESNKVYWQVEKPFVYIKSDCHESYSDDYKLVEKKSKRGRKKKNTEGPKKFKSNVSFVLRRYIHRKIKKDNFTKTALKCEEHVGCEIMIKDYNIRLFNKGKVVCVGVLNEDKSDFFSCIEEIINFLKKKSPGSIYVIKNIKSTVENYQFSLNQNIDLYKLKDFFIFKSQELINIDYNKLYKFFAETCLVEKYDYSNETLITLLNQKNTVCKHVVSKQLLLKILNNFNLKVINLNFMIYWKESIIRRKYEPGINIKYAFLKQFIIYNFKPYRKQLNLLGCALVKSVIFKEPKNTLMVKKNIDDCNVNIRIFGTGNINIQGSKSRVTAEKAYNELCTIIKENKSKILYLPDNPPLINFDEIISVHF